MASKEPITAIGSIAPDSEKEFRHEFRSSGTLTEIFVSTYVGHEFDLQYTFEIQRGDDNVINLLKPLDKAFLAGNGENFQFPIRQDYDKRDELVITVANKDTTQTYHHNCNVQADGMGGLGGILGGIFNG